MAGAWDHRNLFFCIRNPQLFSEWRSVGQIDREWRDGKLWPVEKPGSISVRLGAEEHINGWGTPLQRSFFFLTQKLSLDVRRQPSHTIRWIITRRRNVVSTEVDIYIRSSRRRRTYKWVITRSTGISFSWSEPVPWCPMRNHSDQSVENDKAYKRDCPRSLDTDRST